jgi:hypothetical protein
MAKWPIKMLPAMAIGLGICLCLSSCRRFSPKCLDAKQQRSKERLTAKIYNSGDKQNDSARNKRVELAEDQVLQLCTDRLTWWFVRKVASTP